MCYFHGQVPAFFDASGYQFGPRIHSSRACRGWSTEARCCNSSSWQIRGNLMEIIRFIQPNHTLIHSLVGGWATSLKKWWVRQLGWWHSQYMESHKTCSKLPTNSSCHASFYVLRFTKRAISSILKRGHLKIWAISVRQVCESMDDPHIWLVVQ